MLENLAATRPENRRPALLKELRLLDQALETIKLLPDDLTLARPSDR